VREICSPGSVEGLALRGASLFYHYLYAIALAATQDKRINLKKMVLPTKKAPIRGQEKVLKLYLGTV